MISNINRCAFLIKNSDAPQVLLRHPRGYELVRASSADGTRYLNESSPRFKDVIGVFTRTMPYRDIYNEAGEPVPGEGR